jgi:hypothetical protein
VTRETEETGRSDGLSGFNDLFWGGFRRIPSGAPVLLEKPTMRQYYFLKFIKIY